MSTFTRLMMVGVVTIAASAVFFSVFNGKGDISAIEPAAGLSEPSQELKAVLSDSLERANRALEEANAKLESQNTFDSDVPQ